MEHANLPCPSLSPRTWSNSCPSSQWCHPTISSSVIPVSSCLQSFPASGSFPMSQFFTSGIFPSGGQSIGVSASASVLPVNIQDLFPSGLISVQFKQLPRVYSTPQFKSSSLLEEWKGAVLFILGHLATSLVSTWVGKIPWRRTWQPTPVFLPGESNGQRSLLGFTVQGVTKSRTWLKWLSMHTHCIFSNSYIQGHWSKQNGRSRRILPHST